MMATLLRSTTLEPEPMGEPQVVAMWRVQPGAVMLLGRSPGPLAKGGSARQAATTGAAGIFRAEFWPLEGQPGYGFLAAIRLSDTVGRADDTELILRGARGSDRAFRLRPVAASSEANFGKQVATLVGAHAARLARFMLDMMAADHETDMRQPGTVLDAYLSHAARPDGCVELIAHVPHRCLLLQGWGTPPTDVVEVLLPYSGLLRHAADAGDFSRNDVIPPSTGIVLILPPETADAVTSMKQIFILSGDDLLSRRVVEPNVLGLSASIGQIRHLLPRLNCPVPIHALLRATVQPVYEGRDTLNAPGRPIRAALDVAVQTPGGGAYLSGWLFDPTCQAAELHLCADGFNVRLDESWIRVPREDVSAAFRSDPAFPLPITNDAGFAVAIATAPSTESPPYLRITFSDGDLAFVPITFANSGTPNVLNGLMASVDLHKSSGHAIIEHHLAPFVAQMPSPAPKSPKILLRGPLERPRMIIVPLRSAIQPRSFISSFLDDPALADEQVVFVCGPEWGHAQCDMLIALISFYDLPASVIVVEQTPLSATAVCVAAALSCADDFLLVSAGAVGRMPGWRQALTQEVGTGRVACPTILFEDFSLRFASSRNVRFLDQAPFISIDAPYVGTRADPTSIPAATGTKNGILACCLLPRSTLPFLERAAQFKTEGGQEAAFFLYLREAGLDGAWIPAIQVIVPEEDTAAQFPALPLIDGWMLRHNFAESEPCAS